jgi:hypothetical protein
MARRYRPGPGHRDPARPDDGQPGTLPTAGDQCRVMAWPEGRDGRKLTAGSALLGLGGQVLAAARTVWLTVPRPDPAPVAEAASRPPRGAVWHPRQWRPAAMSSSGPPEPGDLRGSAAQTTQESRTPIQQGGQRIFGVSRKDFGHHASPASRAWLGASGKIERSPMTAPGFSCHSPAPGRAGADDQVKARGH